MAKLKAALEAVARGLKIQHALRSKAVRRMKARHAEQATAERQAKAARLAADRLRANAQRFLTFGPGQDQAKGEALLRKASRKDEKALRLDAKVERAKAKAIIWKQRAKRKTQVIEGLHKRHGDLEAKLEAMQPHVGPQGKVVGAEPGEGAIWVARFIASKCAGGERPNFYSMSGSGFNVQHAIDKGTQPHIGQLPGQRSDCSLFVTEVCWAADLPDPNGLNYTAGYTGTLLGQHNGWQIVSEDVMRKRGWGIVVYLRYPGDTVGHHTEFYVGEGGTETIGHGSAPVDPGVVNLFGDGLYACLVLN